MPLSPYFETIGKEVDAAMSRYTPPAETFPPIIHEAMRYSLFAGGKRLRPLLAIAACDLCGGNRENVWPFAVALEMIHTYTLIHDDLPALDNDDLRRGVPTSHKKFGEANAILAGDALLTHAFELMTNRDLIIDVSPERQLKVAAQTAKAIGSQGTIGGQVVDLEMEGAIDPDFASLEYIHTHKTGKLIVVSLQGGAILGGAPDATVDALSEYGRCIGLAFQVADDILDIVGDQAQLGKTVGADIAAKKLTYPALMGMDESRRLGANLITRAKEAIAPLGDAGNELAALADYIMERTF
jgi:geranylgeranyl diphosphate synthase type II